MIDELSQTSTIAEWQRSSFKSVNLKIITNKIFNSSYCRSQFTPLFKKECFRYGKHELAKIIDFNQLQILFKPFKNQLSIRKLKLLEQYKSESLNFILFFVIFFGIHLLMQEDMKIWIILVIQYFIIYLLLSICQANVRDTLLNKLSNICKSLSQKQNDVQISLIRFKIQGCKKYFLNETCFFKIRSKTILQDDNIIKLYTHNNQDRLAFQSESRFFNDLNVWNLGLNQPIFTKQAFWFDDYRLQRILSFQELQLLFRPLKSTQAYLKFTIWSWCRLVPLVCFIISSNLLIVCINFFREIAVFIISYLLVLILIIYAAMVLRKYRKEFKNEFIKHCEIISMQNYKVTIIPNLDQQSHKDIFCLQIKSKSS